MEGALKLYRTTSGPLVEFEGRFYPVPNASWDYLFNDPNLRAVLTRVAATESEVPLPRLAEHLPPIEGQEVWAAGVTYWRSRDARMQEAKEAGGGDFYDRVYEAERPELFLKATPHRVAGHGQAVRIRKDTNWSVPEPELALAVNRSGQIIGYTVGNDMSARDIEGENPLYLPQAKVYDQCCGLGPAVLIADGPLSPETALRIVILREGASIVSDGTTLSAMRRSPEELVSYLFRDNSFPNGCFLLTGTGIVPPDEFTLYPGDQIRISIDHIGILENVVVQNTD